VDIPQWRNRQKEINQFSGVHKLVDPLDGDLTLDEEDDEHGQDVERDPQQVEEGQGDKGGVGILVAML